MKFILWFFLLFTFAFAQTTNQIAPAYLLDHSPDKWTKQEVTELIQFYASRYEVNSGDMYRIVECETAHTFRVDIKSGYPGEESYGLAQIHLPSHPTISKDQATDPNFALSFLAQNMKAGKASMWSCATLLGIE